MILCCGEALIDMVPIESKDGRTGFAPLPGGAIFNTAIALGRLGEETGFLSGLSTDLFGDLLCEMLDASKVDAKLAIKSDRPTTLAFVRLLNGHASYTFYDENSAGRMLAPNHLPDVPPSVKALYFGGISLCATPAADTYAQLAAREAAGAVIMIDPNIRESFITDEPAYRARLQALLKIGDIVKVSDEDLNWLVPGEVSLAHKASALRSAATSLVIVTKGKEGATAYLSDGSEVSAPARLVEVRDTVGAGDTFNAGVLASLSEQDLLSKDALKEVDGAAIVKALAFGADVAAVTVSRDGANPPWRHELS